MLALMKFPIFLFLIWFTFIEFSESYVVRRDVKSDFDDSNGASLYNGFCKVMVFNSTNFNQVVYQEQKDKLWLVEFYNHWCGYCIRFVAVMKAFATEVYGE